MTDELKAEVATMLRERGCDDDCISFYQKEEWAYPHFVKMLRDPTVPQHRRENQSGYWVSTLRKYVEEHPEERLTSRVFMALGRRGVDESCSGFFAAYPMAYEAMVSDLENPALPPETTDRQSAYWTVRLKKYLQQRGILERKQGGK